MRFGWLMNKGDNHRYIIMDSTNEDIDDVDPLLYMKATYFARACFLLQYKIPVESVREIVARYRTEEFFAEYPKSDCPVKLRKILRVKGKKERWVCFYRTQKGLSGEEPGKHGHESHMHFISCDYGVSKEDIINGIRNGETPSIGYHVRIEKREYGEKVRGSLFDW